MNSQFLKKWWVIIASSNESKVKKSLAPTGARLFNF